MEQAIGIAILLAVVFLVITIIRLYWYIIIPIVVAIIVISGIYKYIKYLQKNKKRYIGYINAKDHEAIVKMHESGEYINNHTYIVARANIGISKEQVKRDPFSYMENIQKIENIMRTNNYYNNYNFEFLYNKGVCCFYLEKFSEAVKYFDEALALKKDPRGFYNRALCRFKLKDITNALKDFQIATRDKEIFQLPNVQEAKNFVDKIYGDI